MAYRLSLVLAVLALSAACGSQGGGREFLADSTGSGSTRKSTEYWLKQLDSTSTPAVLQALDSLGHDPTNSADHVHAIAKLLTSTNDSIGDRAAWALTRIGAEAFPILKRALDSPEPSVRIRAARALGESGQSSSSALIKLMAIADTDPVPQVRSVAKEAAQKVGGQTVFASKELQSALAQGAIRKERYHATGRTSAGVPDAILMAGVYSDTLSVRLDAIHRLGVSGSSNAHVVPRLLQLLGDSVRVVRNAAIEALVQKGPSALPLLQVALTSQRPRVRVGAMVAIAGIKKSF